MNLNKIAMIIKMSFDKNVIKQLFKVYRIYSIDEKFTLKKYLKLIIKMLKGEKIIKHEDKYIISTFMPPIPSNSFISNAIAVDDIRKVFTKQLNAKRISPISIYLCLTHKCPNNCIYCSSKNRIKGKELNTQEWKNTIKNLQDMNTSIIGIGSGK